MLFRSPLYLEKGPAKNPLFAAFFDAAVQAGYTRTDDVNGYKQEGFGPFDKNIKRGRRWSSARAYLHPVMKRRNLVIKTRTQVHRVVFEGDTAVEYVPGRNAAPSPYHFELEVDPLAWADINDRDVVQAVFHSHLSSPPRPSRTDVQNIGLWAGQPYLIYCLRTDELAAWRIQDGAIEPLPLEQR